MKDVPLPFLLERSHKRKRSVALLICPRRGLVVQAPYCTSEAYITKLLLARQEWIEAKLQGLQDSKRKDDSPLYLGKPYILEVSPILGSKNTCELMGDVLFVRLRKKGEAAKVLEQWYRKEALRVLTERSRHFASLLQVVPTEIVVKTQKTRWGSCDRHNVIRYNWRIVMAPPELLDYLVIHELAHIKEKNHGPNFWALVESILPDYQEKRRALKSFHPSH